jgi:hypothetical protein
MTLDLEKAQQELNAAYAPLLDPEVVRERLRGVDDSRWPDPDAVIRELNGPFLIAAHEQYAESSPRVVIVGQENNDWAGLTYPRFSDFHAAHPKNLTTMLDHYREFITARRYNSPFFQYFRKLREAIHGEQSAGRQQSILWLNLCKLNYRGMCSWKSPLYEQMLAIQEGVVQAEIKALDPHVVIFLTGPNYDPVIGKLCPDYKSVEVPPFKPRQLMQIAASGLPCLTFRSYHPGYVHRRGEKGWAHYQAIVDRIRA